jgi:predicted transporter
MSFNDLYRTVFTRLEHLSLQQFVLLAVIIVLFGIFCMRGFGSRSNY